MNTETRMINDWRPEVRSLLKSLIAANHTPVKGNNGEDEFTFDPAKQSEFVDNLIACDEAHLYVACPDGKTRWLFLVLGNSPGELVSDYACPAEGIDTLEPITMAHYDKWTGRKQPKMASPY